MNLRLVLLYDFSTWEEIRESTAQFTDFMHVSQFRDVCWKFAGQVPDVLFFLNAFQTVFR